jgi:ABC-type multidrug transport system fused ATPase/permease subunit
VALLDRTSAAGWRTVAGLARPFRRELALIALFALLATGTDLLAPLIYREAVNDIAGLFVNRPPAGARVLSQAEELSAALDDEARAPAAPADPRREPHRRGRVAPRTAEQAFRTLMWSVGLLFAISVLSHLCSLVADQRTVTLAGRIEADFIQGTFGHVLRLPLGFFAKRASGTLAKQIDQSDQIAPIVTAFAKEIAPAVLSMLGVMAIMLHESWKLSIAALVTLPPYAWIVVRSSRRLETGLERYYEMWDGVSSRIQDALGAIKTVKLSGAEEREVAHFRARSRAAYATFTERNRLANRYVFWQTTLGYLSQALVLGYGGWLVFEHRLTPGDVVMFVVYLDHLYAPIESLTSLFVTVQEHFASLGRATRLLEFGAEGAGAARSSEPLRPGPGHVELRHVHFGYQPEREVLTDVSFALAPGRMTALVGPSGAGKTTTADLLLKLYEPAAGEILLDGQPLARLDAAAVRREIGVVAADGAMFRGSIADNIRYKRPEASDGAVRLAALAAGLGNTLARLPQGLDTPVGEGGVGLSVGERQRLQIARALVAEPRVLILDEATANLDYATETGIREALLARPVKPTTLVITHRYSMAEICDHVVVLSAGRVLAAGSPAQLRASCAWFAEFAASASPAPGAADELPADDAGHTSPDDEDDDDDA